MLPFLPAIASRLRSSLLTVLLLWLLGAPQVGAAAPRRAVVRPAEQRGSATHAAVLDEQLVPNGEAVALVAPWAAPLIPCAPVGLPLLPVRAAWAGVSIQIAALRPATAVAGRAQARLLRASLAPQAP